MVLRWLWCSNCNWDNWGSSLDNWGSLDNLGSSLDNRGSLGISLNHRSSSLDNWGSSLNNWCSSSIVFIVLGIGEVSILHRWGHHFFLSHRSVGIHNSRGFFSNNHWGSSSFRGRSSINMVHREVGGSNSEPQGITQVVDGLDNAIGINIAVASSCDSISSLQLLLGGMTIAVSIVELTIVILGMELVVGSIHCSSHHRHSSRGSSLNWGSSLSNRGSSNNWGSSLDNWSSIGVAASIRVVGLHNLGRGNLSNRGSSSNWCHSWVSSNSNWGSSWGINLMHREVGGSNSESKTISNVVHSLDNSIRIHIAVSSSDDTISSLHFLLDRVSIRISKRVLSKVILGMVLR